MSLDQRVQTWLSNIQQSTDDLSPLPEPYADVPPNPMKRRRVDSPPRGTWEKMLSPSDPFYDVKKRCLELQAKNDKLDEEIAIKNRRLEQYAKNDMLRGKLARIENRPLKKRATASNQVSSEVQQQYCNFINYSTGKVERRLISRRVESVSQTIVTPSRVTSATGFGSSNSARPLRSEEVKVEPDTEPVSWPQQVKANPVTIPLPVPSVQTTRLEPNIGPPPTALTTLLERINDMYAGRGILSSQLRKIMVDAPRILSLQEMTWASGRESDVHYSPQRHELGDMPSPMDVDKLMCRAALCAKTDTPPSEWNMEVVQKVLELSFRDSGLVVGQDLVDFRCSTDGVIVRDYHPYLGSPQPPDFCVYVEPTCDAEPDMPFIIKDFQKNCNVYPFNHIDLKSLQHRPIAFHVHTLAQNTNTELQRVRASFAAHLGFLRRLVRLRERHDYFSLGRHGLPEFLPGVIVHKHNWFLSILKPGEENARFYRIGDTATSMGVFKIVYALQVLRDWVKTEYWPWMHKLLFEWP
ncbi:hypothetical protein FPCIR_5435 [Fusarium pseudocircinatum]|uniref:PD-(D/E)XK nuclease-like domain-containing protein n=1 Tax=Fusarium pseudocircinatum TaxID=56676 RepID=A0A8H5UNN5_9HYPO|nr:hypothetical protein FPCIR_5435 [Fusarium pseudocircinatum]